MRNFLQQLILGNSLQDWLFAALAFVFTFTMLPLLRGVVRRQARRYATRDLPAAAALLLFLIERTSRLFLLTVALFAAERILALPGRSDRVADVVIVASFWLQVGLWLMAAVHFGLQRRTAAGNDRQLGVNITALVAGLGVGGIAIALEFEVLFFVPVTRTNELSIALDAVNRAVLAGFTAAGIAFAYPTRSVHLVQA